MMNPYQNLDTLYDFLKNIKTIEEFFARKEPDFRDADLHAFVKGCQHYGMKDADILSSLKSNERQRVAEELGGRPLRMAH